MKWPPAYLVACLLAVCTLALPGEVQARARRHVAPMKPVLVELFTAQGCEGCPQADLALGELAKKKGVVALTFSVDIWDYTGWTNSFAQPEFTERQKAYVKRLKLREMYTPEMVVDGAGQAEGLDKDAVAALIAKAAKARGAGPGVQLSSEGDSVALSVAKAPPAPADVWLVRYDPKAREVKVKAGDNRGKTVVATNVVRELVKLGQWRGRAKRFDLPDATAEGLKTVVIVQAPRGGPVLALSR